MADHVSHDIVGFILAVQPLTKNVRQVHVTDDLGGANLDRPSEVLTTLFVLAALDEDQAFQIKQFGVIGSLVQERFYVHFGVRSAPHQYCHVDELPPSLIQILLGQRAVGRAQDFFKLEKSRAGVIRQRIGVRPFGIQQPKMQLCFAVLRFETNINLQEADRFIESFSFRHLQQ